MLESLKEKIYIAQETIRGYWYALTHLREDEEEPYQEDIERYSQEIAELKQELQAQGAYDNPPWSDRGPSYASSGSSRSASSSAASYRTDYRECRKHGDYIVFYDLKKHFECPECIEERERIEVIEFLKESEMEV